MGNISPSLENKLHERISKTGELGFWLIPGAMLLDARKNAGEVNPGVKVFNYAVASVIEAEKLAVYYGVAYELLVNYIR